MKSSILLTKSKALPLRIVLKCVVVALLLVLAVLTMTFNWSICHDGIQDIVSGRFSSEYRFNVIYSGGAFDQGGLTKLVILIFAMELLAVLCYALAVSISHSRRLCFPAFFV